MEKDLTLELAQIIRRNRIEQVNEQLQGVLTKGALMTYNVPMAYSPFGVKDSYFFAKSKIGMISAGGPKTVANPNPKSIKTTEKMKKTCQEMMNIGECSKSYITVYGDGYDVIFTYDKLPTDTKYRQKYRWHRNFQGDYFKVKDKTEGKRNSLDELFERSIDEWASTNGLVCEVDMGKKGM